VEQEILHKRGVHPPETEVCTLFVFNDLLLCASARKGGKLRANWKVQLETCHVAFHGGSDPYIEIKEPQLQDKEPFITLATHICRPSQIPYDFLFWKSSIQGVLNSLRSNQGRILMDLSFSVMKHMKAHLFGECQRSMMKIGGSKVAFSFNDQACEEMPNALFIIDQGSVRVERLLQGVWEPTHVLHK
jgi:hypothetical protein